MLIYILIIDRWLSGVEINISEKWLPVYEALASKVRIQMIQALAVKKMNIRELAETTGLSSAIMTMHVKKLENSGIIQTKMIPGRGGAQRICWLSTEYINIAFPQKEMIDRKVHQTELYVGHYTDFRIEPTCGLATIEHIIGEFDDPRCFLNPERVNAKILWFGQGYIEYKVPNYLLTSEQPEELEISMEISSEAPGTNNVWPSDISFLLNDVKLGTWTSPGDFGGRRGKYTPAWWNIDVNQYGLLKQLKINKTGTFMDGNQISNVTIDQINIQEKQWTFKISIPQDATHVGGVTLFGTGFGNYNQDIVFKLHYTPITDIR